jgi:hypothetical protein
MRPDPEARKLTKIKNKPDFQPFKVAFVQTYKHPGTATVKQAMDPLFPIPYPDPYGTTV